MLAKPEIPLQNQDLENLSPQEILKKLYDVFPDKVALSMSLQAEDVVLLDMIVKLGKPVKVYALDTGRLHEATYRMMDSIRYKYHIDLEVYFPKAEDVEKLVREKGLYSFKESVENRKECCYIRKVLPNNRALKGMKLWITGIRRDMSEDRKNTPILEWDDSHHLYKAAPLANWTRKQVHEYAKENHVPYHPLYNEGYLSIGCEPCTRAVQEGEDERAGRWWWEQEGHKECGLHFH
ncbi:MAG: phosphoadenylyl-sulfate reductase [Candidatus Hydrogenedentota bacterium]|nr:MAG: phosphoadenylyl-sulfate reductase [Candidatus Hydrogenedentota bacterium]